MKLVVDDVAYDITESLQGAALGDLMNLKLKTRRPDDKFLGVTVRFIQDTFESIGTRMQGDGFDPIDLLGDVEFLSAMTGLIYLARRRAGDRIEVSDAANTGFSSVHIEPDEDVEAPKEDSVPGEPPIQ